MLTVLGSILLCGIAIVAAAFLIWRSERKKAAVGRRCAVMIAPVGRNDGLTLGREMQLFLVGYIIIEICEIFTVGGFPLDSAVRRVSFWPDEQRYRLTRSPGLRCRSHGHYRRHTMDPNAQRYCRLPTP